MWYIQRVTVQQEGMSYSCTHSFRHISETLSEEASHRRIDTVGFHLYKIQKHAKPIQTWNKISKQRQRMTKTAVCLPGRGTAGTSKEMVSISKWGGGVFLFPLQIFSCISFLTKKFFKKRCSGLGGGIEQRRKQAACQCLCTEHSARHTTFLMELVIEHGFWGKKNPSSSNLGGHRKGLPEGWPSEGSWLTRLPCHEDTLPSSICGLNPTFGPAPHSYSPQYS